MKQFFREKDIVLPVGIFVDGEWEKNVKITEIPGSVISDLSKVSESNKGNDVIQHIILNSVLNVGGKPMTKKIYENMIGGICDLLVYEIRDLTKTSSVVSSDIECAKKTCGAVNEGVEVNLKEVPIDGIIDGALTDKFQIESGGNIVFEEYDEETQMRIKFRVPKNKDRNGVQTVAESNPMKAVIRMISNCVIDMVICEGTEQEYKPKNPVPVNIFDDILPLRFQEAALKMFNTNKIGPNINIKVKCWQCGHKNTFSLENSDFLYRVTQ